MLRLILLVALALGLAGCAADEPSVPEDQPTPHPDLALPGDAVEATAWRDTGLPVEFDAEERHTSPEELVEAVAAALAAELEAHGAALTVSATVLDATDAHASGRVVVGGFLDDSVYGGDYFMALARDEGGWHVDQAWTRDLCRRGVGDALCV